MSQVHKNRSVGYWSHALDEVVDRESLPLRYAGKLEAHFGNSEPPIYSPRICSMRYALQSVHDALKMAVDSGLYVLWMHDNVRTGSYQRDENYGNAAYDRDRECMVTLAIRVALSSDCGVHRGLRSERSKPMPCGCQKEATASQQT